VNLTYRKILQKYPKKKKKRIWFKICFRWW